VWLAGLVVAVMHNVGCVCTSLFIKCLTQCCGMRGLKVRVTNSSKAEGFTVAATAPAQSVHLCNSGTICQHCNHHVLGLQSVMMCACR
jgi:hypothetical protein